MNDFAEALLECINVIAQDSKNHVQLFARDKKRHEAWLQSYVLVRLRDLLLCREPHNVVFTPREPKEGREEPDILAEVEGEDRGRLEVPIEIKWSHNTTVISALKEQLGERYLRRSGRKRGVYLAGFSGHPPNSDKSHLERRLQQEGKWRSKPVWPPCCARVLLGDANRVVLHVGFVRHR